MNGEPAMKARRPHSRFLFLSLLLALAAVPRATLAAQSCDASDQCMTGGTCQADGECTGTPKPNGSSCDDGNECTKNDGCQAGVCKGTPDTDKDGQVCHAFGLCVPGTCLVLS